MVYKCLVENELIYQRPVKDCILSRTFTGNFRERDYAPDIVFIEDSIKDKLSSKQIEDILYVII